MVVPDPAAELIRLVTAAGDPPPREAAPAEVRAALLIRRRFGLALPTPFVGLPAPGEPIRRATAEDGAAIAAIKWRCFGTNYRGGVLADDFLDERDIVPPVSYWVGRAMVPPSRRHALLVWGRPGTVHGYLEAGPAHVDDALDPDAAGPHGSIGEVAELYVDPSAQGAGGGAGLLAAGEAFLAAAGCTTLELAVVATNPRAIAFYERHGWAPTGRERQVELEGLSFTELRCAKAVGRVAP